jgi:uncharacterized protein (TIGR02145 family)
MIFLLPLILYTALHAQIPDKISYQAVARDTLGHLITNQTIGFRIGIMQDEPDGPMIYSERHSVDVNQFGMITIAIGDGYALSGSFDAIAWGSHTYYIRTEIDLSGGGNFSLLGISPILSVAHSLHAGGLLLEDENGKLWVVKVDSSGTLFTETLAEQAWQCGESFTDARDGKVYETVQIGSQCWLAENLNVGVKLDLGVDQTDNDVPEKYCYDGLESNCEIYGGLYQWNEMMQYDTLPNQQGLCPAGWVLPGDADYKILEGTVDSLYSVGDPEWDKFNEWRGYNAGKVLKTTEGWFENSGTDVYGFSTLGGGLGEITVGYTNLTRYAFIWTSSKRQGESSAWSRWFGYDNDDVMRDYNGLNVGFSVRCIKKWQCGQSFMDPRDNQIYETVEIGDQCWMAQNVNAGTMIQRTVNQSDNGILEKYCLNNDPSNCDCYGGIYVWNEAMQYSTAPGSQGVCPPGWFIPTDSDWKILEGNVDSQYGVGNTMWNTSGDWRGYDVGKNLKSLEGWDNGGNGVDLYGFNALPTGQILISGGFCCEHQYGAFWTSSQYDAGKAWYFDLFNANYLEYRYYIDKNWGFGIRCMQNINHAPAAPSNPDPATGASDVGLTPTLTWVCTDINGDDLTYDIYLGLAASPPLVESGHPDSSWTSSQLLPDTTYYWKIVARDDGGLQTEGPIWTFSTVPASFMCGDDITDIRDGKTYSTVQIGTQCWMAENLNVGTMINGSTESSNNGTIEKYCYNNSADSCTVYGGLYLWDEMMNYSSLEGAQGICPDGWHVPRHSDWCTLTTFLDNGVDCGLLVGYTGTDGGGKMKETDLSHWTSPNTGATNSSGFTGLPGGHRMTTGGTFTEGRDNGHFWSSTASSSLEAKRIQLSYNDARIRWSYNNKAYGMTVRCLKD